jgi:hypothetical protein
VILSFLFSFRVPPFGSGQQLQLKSLERRKELTNDDSSFFYCHFTHFTSEAGSCFLSSESCSFAFIFANCCTMFGGMNFFPDGLHGGPPRPFRTQYRCYSVSMMPGNERQSLEHGGKIILPPSALDQLTRLNIVYPMLFKLTNGAVRAQGHVHVHVHVHVRDRGGIGNGARIWLFRCLCQSPFFCRCFVLRAHALICALCCSD